MNNLTITDIFLFKVPLYNDYKNVYDTELMQFYLANKDTNQAISDSMFYHLTGLNRMLPLDKRSSLTIKIKDLAGSSIQDIISITYCVLKADKYYYYFVTDYNSNFGNGTITFSIEWDAWQNNIFTLKNNLPNQQVSKMTRNDGRFYAKVGEKAYIKPSDGKMFNGKVDVISTARNLLSTDSKIVLYVRLLLDADYVPTSDSGAVLKDYTASSIYSPLRICYKPFCVVNKNGTVDTGIQTYSAKTRGGNYTNFTMGFLGDWLDNTLFSHIVDLSYTFSSPFTTTYENNSTSIKFSADLVIGDYGLIYNIYGRSFIYEGEKYSERFDVTEDIAETPSLSISAPFDDYHYNGVFMKYPFFYRTVSFNASEVVLSTEKDKPINILTINIDNNINYKLTISNSDSSLSKTEFSLVGEKQGVVNRDSQTEYLRNNKNSDNLNLLLGTIKNVEDYISSSVSLSIGLGGNPLNAFENQIGMTQRYFAKMADIKNSRDQSSLPSTEPTTTIYRNTLPIIKIYECVSDEVKTNIHHNIMLYGVETDEIIDIFNANHLYFDYYVIPNVILTSVIIDNYDRDIIINIMNNGIRIWRTSLQCFNLIQNPDASEALDISYIYNMFYNYYNYNRDLCPYLEV